MAYRIGNVTFGTKLAKEIWILQGVVSSLNYIGVEGELSSTEKALRKLAIRDLNKLIKQKQKESK